MIDEIKDKLEEVYNGFAVLISDAEKNREWKEFLNQEELRLKNKEKDLVEREGKLKMDRGVFEAEIKFVEKVKKEQAAKQKVQDLEWNKITAAQAKIEESDVKLKEIDDKMALLEEKKKEMADIDNKIKDIEDRERAIQKEKIVASERKRVLDEQELINDREKDRLRRLAVSMCR